MKQISIEIKPGIGIGELKLGISKDKATEILGIPEKRDKYSYSNTDKDLTETWFYEKLGLNISFDEEDKWKLSLITIESEPYSLGKHICIGQEKKKVLSELEILKITDIEYEDMSNIESPTHELFSSDKLGINFWFDYDKLTEIQISPLFIDDNTIKWPE
jgi:hypothetical protein